MQSVSIGSNQAGQRLDKFLHKYLPEAQNSFLYKMLRKKNITLNGKKAEGKEILAVGDQVCFFFSEETFCKFSGLSFVTTEEKESKTVISGRSASETYRRAFFKLHGIGVLYEDNHALILDKPAGILSQKAEEKDLSLNEWMIGYLLENGSITEEELFSFKPSVCNRLDRNTSGLVLCGKSLAGSQELSRLIRERIVRKFYRTIVHGTIDRETELSGYLVKDKRTNKVTISQISEGTFPVDSSDSAGSEEKKCQSVKTTSDGNPSDYIKTIYRPLFTSNGLTYLEVELVTGKPHQIRAHLAGIGNPLVGDYKYGNQQKNRPFKEKYKLNSQLLHAYRLEFPTLTGALSGLSGQKMTAPLPDLFKKIVKDIRFFE